MSLLTDKIKYLKSKIDFVTTRSAKTDLKRYQKMIARIMKEHKLSSIKEATDYVESRYYEIFFSNKGISVNNGKINIEQDTTRSDYFMLKTMQEVKKHPEKILDLVDQMTPPQRSKLLTDKDFFIRYTPNMNENYRMLLRDMFTYLLQTAKIDRNNFVQGTMTLGERELLRRRITSVLSENITKIHSEIKSSNVRRVSSMAKLLEENGLFEYGTTVYNSRIRMIGLPELQLEQEKTKKGNKPQFLVAKDLENRKILETMPLDKLIALSAFTTNKLGKEFTSFKKSKFIFDELGVSDDIDSLINVDVENLDETILKSILLKYEYLKSSSREIYSKATSEVLTNLEEAGENVTDNVFYKNVDISDMECISPEYKSIFDRLLPNSKNDFFAELENYNSGNHIYEGIYTKKDFALDPLITSLLGKEDSNINWGYIPEEVDGLNSIQRGKRMILIGIDLEGFNYPIKLHSSRKDLIKLVKGYTGKAEIPLYKGDEDWKVETAYGGDEITMSGQVLVPLDKLKEKL